ncbi:MAG TPA: nitroreductase family protein, partial [Brevibacillus sp.]|nr:nitroreductase family protein [Brevibacillus sp.]
MSIASIIRGRRSIKNGYKPDTVPEKLILELLNDAVYAPNHGLREPWRFLFIPTEKKAQFIERMMPVYPADQQEKR